MILLGARRPGFFLYRDGREYSTFELFMLLNTKISKKDRMAIKKVLCLLNYDPNKHLAIENVKISRNKLCVFEDGYKFEIVMSDIRLLKNSQIKLYHPMGWCVHVLSEQEIALIRKAKKRWNMVYK